MEEEKPFLEREDEGPRMGKLRKSLHHCLVCTQKTLSQKRFMRAFGDSADEQSLLNAYEALHLQLLLNMEPEFDDICEKCDVKEVLNCVDKMVASLKVAGSSTRIAPRVRMLDAIVALKRQEVERLEEELAQVNGEKAAVAKAITDKHEALLHMATLIDDRKAHLEKALATVEEADL
mmetsp:Transcript_9726/g.39549  ORF Transcript_9726/g.39549 Transcript_9726/m.39549 type:complete len:177 (-) Transcript_9726:105-635(-)